MYIEQVQNVFLKMRITFEDNIQQKTSNLSNSSNVAACLISRWPIDTIRVHLLICAVVLDETLTEMVQKPMELYLSCEFSSNL